MSITVYEKPTSRDTVLSFTRGSTITFEGFALATAGEDETAVQAAVQSEISYYYNGFDFLVLQNIKAKPVGGPYWTWSADFALPDGPTTENSDGGNDAAPESGDKPDPSDSIELDNSFSFEIGGGTAHLVASINTITQSAAPGIVIPPTNKMIGVDKSHIHGVDVVSPTFTFSITQVFPKLKIGYMKTLRFTVGTVAGYPHLGFPVGELLLLGASGQYKAGAKNNPLGSWAITFKYGVEHNLAAVTTGNIPPFAKKGWDHVWYAYQDQYDATSGLTVPVPIYASVEQVYPYTNHKRLGIDLTNVERP